METIDYYNQHAEDYYQSTVDLDLSKIYKEFLAYLEPGDHILDAGCGSGRDSRYFLEQGYQVTAVDAAEEMAKLSSELLGQAVLQTRFQAIDFKAEFAGIWACASLLHISQAEIEAVFARLSRALVENGVLYASFKYGDREVRRDGRLFNYYDRDSFRELATNFAQLEIVKLWKTVDVREGRTDEEWLNVLLRKCK